MKAHRILSGVLLLVVLNLNVQASESPLRAAESLLQTAAEHGVAIAPNEAASIADAVIAALASDHRGLQTAALRLVIAYGAAVPMNRGAEIEMVRLYRDHSDPQVRRMAIVAIGASESSWGRDFLQRSERFENSKALQQTIRAVTRAS